jgi:hypothetical protein
VEGPASQTGWLKGLSANYLRVLLPGPMDLKNQIVMLRFRELQGEVLVGEVV